MAVYVDHLRSPGRIENCVCDIHCELMIPEKATAVVNGSLSVVAGYVCQNEGCHRWFIDSIGFGYIDYLMHSFSNPRNGPVCPDENRQRLYLQRTPSADLVWTCPRCDHSEPYSEVLGMNRIEMERDILASLKSYELKNERGKYLPSERIRSLSRFSTSKHDQRLFLDKLDSLESRNMVEIKRSGDPTECTVRLTSNGRERVSMTETEYIAQLQTIPPHSSQTTNTFMGPIGQFNQTHGANSPIIQTIRIDPVDKASMIETLDQIASELKKTPDADHSVPDVEHLKVEVQSDKPRLAKIKEGVENVVSTLKSIAALAPLGEALWKHWEHLQQSGSLL